MNDSTELKAQIKQILVENLMLKISAAEIGDDQPLFGPGSLGLDSVDALQLVVALEKLPAKTFRNGSGAQNDAKRQLHRRRNSRTPVPAQIVFLRGAENHRG